ncbi:MAG: PLP-dependent transferase [Planctomycetes bacterium]|nr:PLP-dependent transferase [Planctomycetota bacterium]
MTLKDYLDPRSCPEGKPRLEIMSASTRVLHEGIDEAMRRTGLPYLHPRQPTIQLDLLGSRRMRAWQEGKASFLLDGDGCWSELPQVYARYGVETTHRLLKEVRALENARGAILTDCGMQACALLFDVLFRPGGHAVLMRQIYNKTRKYCEWLAARLSGSVSIVDDGDDAALEACVRKDTLFVFAETYTNPLMRAVDPERLVGLVAGLRKSRASELRLIVDDTIASPWALKVPLLDHGVDFVVTSGTKSLAGQDCDLWGYIASNRIDALNELMDLEAMRGGILDGRRASAILEGLEAARASYEKRCATASRVAAFLAEHSLVSEVHHPSLPGHPDRLAIDRHYKLPGSLLSFRVRGATEEQAEHFADVLASTVVPRYALSFDGLTTKVNHHRTVSEYFTPAEELERAGIDRLVRLGIGLEEPEDIIACLNWALWRHREVSPDEVLRWQEERTQSLGVYREAPRA